MTQQDELDKGNAEQPADNKQVDSAEPVDASTGEHAAGKPAGKRDIAGGGIGGGEVRAVAPPVRRAPSNLPLLLLVVLVLLLGGGYLLISRDSPPAQVVQKQPIPVRPLNDPQVEEQRIAQQQVAAVPTPQEERPANEVEKDVATAAVAENIQPAAETATQAEAPVAAAAPSVATPPEVATEPEKTSAPVILYSVMVGPFVSKSSLSEAIEQLRALGFEPQQTSGRGMVEMIRLLEGRYPAKEARSRLAALKKKVRSAFVLRDGEQRAIYAGSFYDGERAEKLRSELAESGIRLTPVVGEVEMDGKMLIALQADQQTAREVAEHIGKSGLRTHVVRK